MRQFWVLGESGAAEGPFAEPMIAQGVAEGRWTSTTLVCEVGREEWLPLAGLRDFDFSGAEVAAKFLRGGAKGVRTAAARVSKIEREEIDAWLLLPAKLSEQSLQLLKRLLSERAFEWMAVAFGWVGLVAVPISMVAVVLAMILTAMREDRLSMMGWIVPAFIAACFLQFVSARFSREADVAVRQTPTIYSRASLFDMLGLLLVGIGGWLTVRGVLSAFDQPKLAELHLLLSVAGLLNIAMGGFFLHPKALSMEKRPNTTIGQDGVAVVAGVAKAALRAVRMTFGIAVSVGAVLCWYGTLAYLFNSESFTAIAWLIGGAALVIYGSLLPLLMYLTAMLVFIAVEVIQYFLRPVEANVGAAATSATPDQVEKPIEEASQPAASGSKEANPKSSQIATATARKQSAEVGEATVPN